MEAVSAPCLSVFRRLLGSALNGLLCISWLAMKRSGSSADQAVGLDDLCSPFQLECSVLYVYRCFFSWGFVFFLEGLFKKYEVSHSVILIRLITLPKSISNNSSSTNEAFSSKIYLHTLSVN